MFENFLSNIKRKFNKPSDEINTINKEKTGFRKSIHNLKMKFLKPNPPDIPTFDEYSNTALSPRAVGAGECALTDIEWPSTVDNNPNVLDKFTKIVTIVEVPYNDRNV